MKHITGRAIVVFHGKVDHWWVRFLKQGFKHCFILLEDTHHHRWLLIEPLGSQFEFWTDPHFPTNSMCDPALFYKNVGYSVIETSIKKSPRKIAPANLCTCVEVIKRILGIHHRWILTPYQLYNHLQIIPNQPSVFKRIFSYCQNTHNWWMLKKLRFLGD